MRASKSLLLSVSVLLTAQAWCNSAHADAVSGAVTSQIPLASGFTKSGEESLQMGNYKDAQAAFIQALKDEKNQSLGEQATLHADLGEAYLWQGFFSDTDKELNKAMSLATKANDNALIARVTNLQSWLAQGFGKEDKSIQLCQDAVAMRRKCCPGTGDLADALEHLGILLSSNGLMDPAQKAFEEALVIRRQTTGSNSMDVANLLEQIGGILYKRGNSQQAQQYYLQSLSLKEASDAALQPYSPHIADDSVVFHFIKGAPNCQREFSNGSLIQRITGNGITVQASITLKPSEFVKSTRATVSVLNNSSRTINFLSQPASFIVIRPKIVLAKQLSADQLAQDIEKKGRKKAGWVRFWGQGATTPITTTMIGGNGFMPYGYMPTTFGYMPPFYSNSGNMSIMTTNVPDYQARARAEAKAQQITNRSQADASQIIETALGPCSIQGGASISGSLDFEPVVYSEAILRVPIGNAIFEFHFVPDKD